jgi:hypothetical protein
MAVRGLLAFICTSSAQDRLHAQFSSRTPGLRGFVMMAAVR